MKARPTKSLKKMALQQGFTLIELMIAIGLTGLLLSMAVPALDQFTTSARQTSAINDFVASMHQARSTAVTSNFRTTLCASASGTNCEDVSWDQGWIVFADRDSDQNVDNDETIIGVTQGVDDLDISSPQFGQFLMYRPNGRATTATANGNSGEFTVCDDRGSDHAKVIIVDLSGRPRLSKQLANGSAPSCG